MKIIATAFALAAAATAATAQGRPSTPDLTCRQSAGIVQSQGAAVLGTGGYTYDRFVANRGFCEITEITRAAFVRTRDNPQCFVGYRCREPSRSDSITDRF